MRKLSKVELEQKYRCPVSIQPREGEDKTIWELNTAITASATSKPSYSLLSLGEDTVGLALSAYAIERDFVRTGEVSYRSEIYTQGKYECVAASLSMLLGIKPFFVKRALAKYGWRNDESGVSEDLSIQAAKDLGSYLLSVPCFLINETIGPSLVCVKSLNLKGRYHSVCWNGEETLDPNVGQLHRFTYGPEWAPWTIRSHGVTMLVDKSHLTTSLKNEIDHYHRQVELRRWGTPDLCRDILRKISVRVDP